MHKPEYVRDDEMHKIQRDFEIQVNHLIPARRSDLVLIKKKNCDLVNFIVPVNHRVKIKRKDRQNTLTIQENLKKKKKRTRRITY